MKKHLWTDSAPSLLPNPRTWPIQDIFHLSSNVLLHQTIVVAFGTPIVCPILPWPDIIMFHSPDCRINDSLHRGGAESVPQGDVPVQDSCDFIMIVRVADICASNEVSDACEARAERHCPRGAVGTGNVHLSYGDRLHRAWIQRARQLSSYLSSFDIHIKILISLLLALNREPLALGQHRHHNWPSAAITRSASDMPEAYSTIESSAHGVRNTFVSKVGSVPAAVRFGHLI